MIDYNTIVSTTQDKMTLLQWLKKVEAALKDASATTFKVNKKGDATLTFSIVFADGTELESGEIILQQGESVESAAIVNGHLILTLTNGDELDTGDLGGVTSFSIDASQHLIVHYQNGTTQDLGAIFAGNVNIAGILTAASVKTPVLTADEDEISAQKPVVEVMTGYGFIGQASSENTEIEYVYAGAVKNGNKLTLVVALYLTKIGATEEISVGRFLVPSGVYDALYPVRIGNYDYLVYGKATGAQPNYERVNVDFYINKAGANLVNFSVRNNSLAENAKTYVRIEATFLLSSNLAA